MKTKVIQYIVGDEFVNDWVSLSPTVYYKNGLPYGLIAHHPLDGVVYIASTTRNPKIPFTKNMIRDIIRLYEQHSVCLVSGHEPSWGKLASALSRYNFIYKHVDGVMYAYHFKENA